MKDGYYINKAFNIALGAVFKALAVGLIAGAVIVGAVWWLA